MDLIRIDSASGRWYLDPETGRRLPSVTTVLSVKRNEDLERWRGSVGNRRADQTRDGAAELGTRAHAEVEALNRGTPAVQVLAQCRDDIRAPVRAYYRWARENVAEVLDVECMVANFEDGYAGAFDGRLLLREDAPVLAGLPERVRWPRQPIALVDYKTSSMPHDEWRMQTAAYKRALIKSGTPCDLRIGINCPRDRDDAVNGRIYPEVYGPEDDEEDEAAFLAALTLWRWDRRQEERKPRLRLRR